MRKKYHITSDKDGNFYFNGVDCTLEWFDHFGGLTMEQESRCVKLFIPWYLRRHPDLLKEKIMKLDI